MGVLHMTIDKVDMVTGLIRALIYLCGFIAYLILEKRARR